jgi:hypothetical protein
VFPPWRIQVQIGSRVLCTQVGLGSLVGGEGGLNSKQVGLSLGMSDPRTRKATEEGSSEETHKSFKEIVKGTPEIRGEDVEMGGVCNG